MLTEVIIVKMNVKAVCKDILNITDNHSLNIEIACTHLVADN